MEGIKLDKRQFCWLNDNDAFGIFRNEILAFYETMTDEQKILSGLDSYTEYLNEQLFNVYLYLIVTSDDCLYGWDGFSNHLIGEKLEDIFETAKNVS